MKKFTFLFLGVMCFVSTYSQTTVLLESNGTTNAFKGTSLFIQTYEAAVDGIDINRTFKIV